MQQSVACSEKDFSLSRLCKAFLLFVALPEMQLLLCIIKLNPVPTKEAPTTECERYNSNIEDKDHLSVSSCFASGVLERAFDSRLIGDEIQLHVLDLR